MERYLIRLAESSDRLKLHTYGESYEGRKLYYLVVSSPENMAAVDRIKQNLSPLADPGKIKDESEAETIIKGTPAITWIACNVHGGEHSSGESAVLSGLVWEDIMSALPLKAYLIDERVGQGHIILYADDPNFRAYWDGLNRLFFNSLLFSPSLGR